MYASELGSNVCTIIILETRLEPLMVMGSLNKISNIKSLIKLQTLSTSHTHIENIVYSTPDLVLHAAGFALFCYILSMLSELCITIQMSIVTLVHVLVGHVWLVQ
jgi:hypothetical protein